MTDQPENLPGNTFFPLWKYRRQGMGRGGEVTAPVYEGDQRPPIAWSRPVEHRKSHSLENLARRAVGPCNLYRTRSRLPRIWEHHSPS